MELDDHFLQGFLDVMDDDVLVQLGKDNGANNIVTGKRGRPSKDPATLHPATIHRKFMEEAEEIKQKILDLNKKSQEFNWGMQMEVIGSIKKKGKNKTIFSTENQEDDEKLNIMVKKTSISKTQVSDFFPHANY